MEIEKFINDNKTKLKTLAMFALIFSLGFSAGYYYMEGGNGSEVLTINDGSDNCSKLLKQDVENGSEQASGNNNVSADAVKSPNGAVLSASNAAGGAETAGSEAVVKAFASSKNSTIYHTKDCPYVKRIKPENLVWFSSQKDAQAAGRKPHSCVKNDN